MPQPLPIKLIQKDEDSRRNWRTINQLIDWAKDVLRRLHLLELASQRRFQTGGGEITIPFLLYQSGTWLQWKVTDGILITTSDPITVTNVETQFTLTSGVARYWFYIDVTATTGTIATSATTLVWSATKIPLGWVNTTNTTDSISVPTQFFPLHLFNPCAP